MNARSEHSDGEDRLRRGFFALPRALRWAYRGVRWRLVGSERKVLWAYRGIRWRVVGKYRRVYWKARRGYRALASSAKRLLRRARFGIVRSVSPIRGIMHPSRLRQAWQSRRSQGETLSRLLEAAGVEPPACQSSAVHRRIRRVVRRPLRAAREATALTAQINHPFKSDRQARRRLGIARLARFSFASPPSTLNVLTTVLGPLLSGRPVVDTQVPALRYVSESEARHLDEIERMHLANAQLRSLVLGDPQRLVPSVNVVLSTNRPDFVPGAIERLQGQRMVEIELKLGLHGCKTDFDQDSLTGGAVVDVEVVEYPASQLFGDVLTDLTLRGACEYVAKCDDDDHYGAHHLFDLWLAAQLSGAPLVGKGAEFVFLEDREIVLRRRGGPILTPSRFIAGGAMMVHRAAMDAVGNWGHVARGVDQDLMQRMEKRGLAPFRIHGLEFVLSRHGEGHTWDAEDDYFLEQASEAWGVGGLRRAGVLGHESPTPSAVSKNNDPTVSFCIPNKDNVASQLRFERLVDRDQDIREVVIADDRSSPPLGSTSGSGLVKIVRVPDGIGFGAGRARHRAATAATGEVLHFCDADITVSSRALREVAKLHGPRPTAVHAVLQFSEVNSDLALELIVEQGWQGFEEVAGANALSGQDWREPHWAQSADMAHVRSSSFRACVGGFVSVDKGIYEASGGFRDVPVRGVEDTEFGYRLQVLGCRQQLYRGGGILHLGERTFSQQLAAAETQERERTLARFVPIWARSFEERAALLTAHDDTPVPFVAFPDGGSAPLANAAYGGGTAVCVGDNWGILDAPFCFSTTPASPESIAALPEALQAFRLRSCGVVTIIQGGEEIGSLVALWAINHQRATAGQEPIIDHQAAVLDSAKQEIADAGLKDAYGQQFVQV